MKPLKLVWRIIEKQSKGKAIILTTHSMEEADALSTRDWYHGLWKIAMRRHAVAFEE